MGIPAEYWLSKAMDVLKPEKFPLPPRKAKKGIKYVDRALEIDAEDFRAWYFRGVGFMSLAERDKTTFVESMVCFCNSLCFGKCPPNWELEKLFEKCLGLEIQIVMQHPNKKRYQNFAYNLTVGKYQDLIDACDNVLEAGKANHVLWTTKAFALMVSRQYEDALDCVDQALQIMPDYEPAKKIGRFCLQAAVAYRH